MRVEVLGGVERRRRWSQDDKVRIVEETLAPGAKVTEVARRNGIAASVVWRGFLIIPPTKSPSCFRGLGKLLNNPRPPSQRKARSCG
jgi:hypothetical protein